MSQDRYLLKFDGASKGNPGKAGAGAFLQSPSGSTLEMIAISKRLEIANFLGNYDLGHCQGTMDHEAAALEGWEFYLKCFCLQEGLGIATCNVAEYRALRAGLRAALDYGVCDISVQGDSLLVCNQINGKWKVHNKTLASLHEDVKLLIKNFNHFSIEHVYRECNTAADALANLAVELEESELQISPDDTIILDVSKQTKSRKKQEQKCTNEVGNEEFSSMVENSAIADNRTYGGAGKQMHEQSNILDVVISNAAVCSCDDLVSETVPLEEMVAGSEFAILDRAHDVSQQVVVYQLEYDAISKRKLGKSGIGALLRSPNGSVFFVLKEEHGSITPNAAYYHALIAGLRAALDYGISRIIVQGHSRLIIEQLVGKLQVRDKNLVPLWKEVDMLRGRFEEFHIKHVDKNLNTAANLLANAAARLPETMFSKAGFSICNQNSGRRSYSTLRGPDHGINKEKASMRDRNSFLLFCPSPTGLLRLVLQKPIYKFQAWAVSGLYVSRPFQPPFLASMWKVCTKKDALCHLGRMSLHMNNCPRFFFA